MTEVRQGIKQRLIERTIPIDQIYLDPNNLRLSGIRRETSEHRFFEDSVQRAVLVEMERFDIDSLKKSFMQNGILPVDRIIVREHDSEHYIVVEGNRRIAAIKNLLEEHEAGEIDLSSDRLEELSSLEVLLLGSATKEDTLLIQGLRHVPGIREWGAYQRAEAIGFLVEAGYAYKDVSNIMGGILQPSAVGRYYRARQAFRQMMEDDEYGRFAKPDYFTYFVELLKTRFSKIREWLEWNSRDHNFDNEDNRKAFYKWLTGDDNREERQIRTVVELRSLPTVFDHPSAKRALFEGATVETAKTHIIVPPEWRSRLHEFEDFIKHEIPITEQFTEDDVNLLLKIRELIDRILQRINPEG